MPPDQNQAKPQGEFQQVVERLREANNILVTISNNPTVDQFAACIGLTLVLNKLGKHANAVFSGTIPSTIDFLKPEDTLEKNTDSLRDFIIALDKSKADKLRYKVENDVVKVFITPYKTNISEKDLEFSHGDFNVDAVIALGVQDKSHLDAAILAHGRILHDAAVISINNKGVSKLGSINWSDKDVSSLCEMVADVAREMSVDAFDQQNATALLTGIVAETERYSNEKASPHTMSIAGVLMSAGASTQLVTTKLEAPVEKPHPQPVEKAKNNSSTGADDDGVIEIDHDTRSKEKPVHSKKADGPQEPAESEENAHYDAASQIEIDEHGRLKSIEDSEKANESENSNEPPKVHGRMITEPPSRGGQITANDRPEDSSDNIDPLQPGSESPVSSGSSLSHKAPKVGPARASGLPPVPTINDSDDAKNLTLSDIEKSVHSPHSELPSINGGVPELGIDETREAVEKAAGEAEIDASLPQVRGDLSAQLFDEDKGDDIKPPTSSPPKVPPPPMIPSQ